MTPDTHTNQQFQLDVGDGHTLYVLDWGNPDATTPFFFLHGGPGSGVKDKHKATFDPAVHRVIFFDQRGAGLSTPAGSLEHNTTDDLVADISKIADHLEIGQFYLLGNSWGSTLSLAYALAHPDRVAGLIVGGVFTGTTTENTWLDGGGFRSFFPDAWQAYLDRTPAQHHDDPSAYHFDKFMTGTPEEQKASAYAYESMERAVMRLDDRLIPEDYETYDPANMRIEMHYMKNNCFMPDRQILDNAAKLSMPVFIVQGRYDAVCPPITAYELHQKLPNSRLYWTQSGHAIEHEGQNVLRAIVSGLR